MTLKHDICKMFRRKEVIPCGADSYIKYTSVPKESKTIDVRINDVWMKIVPPIPDYRYYSHTISPEILFKYHPDTFKKMYGDIDYKELYAK